MESIILWKNKGLEEIIQENQEIPLVINLKILDIEGVPERINLLKKDKEEAQETENINVDPNQKRSLSIKDIHRKLVIYLDVKITKIMAVNKAINQVSILIILLINVSDLLVMVAIKSLIKINLK